MLRKCCQDYRESLYGWHGPGYVYDDNSWDQREIYIRVNFKLPEEFLNYRITALTIWDFDSLTAFPNLSTDRREMKILNLQNENTIEFG